MGDGKMIELPAYVNPDSGDLYLRQRDLTLMGYAEVGRFGFIKRPTKAGVWLMFDGEAFAACTVLDNGVICYGDTLTTAQKLGAEIRYRFLCQLPAKPEDT